MVKGYTELTVCMYYVCGYYHVSSPNCIPLVHAVAIVTFCWPILCIYCVRVYIMCLVVLRSVLHADLVTTGTS